MSTVSFFVAEGGVAEGGEGPIRSSRKFVKTKKITQVADLERIQKTT